MQTTRNTSISYLALRRWLGILGLTLPVIVWAMNDFTLKSSISHFYYSHASVVFTGFMCAFGLFLIFYPGREKDEGTKFSDDWITTLGGSCAILTALIPTSYGDGYVDIDQISTPFMHNDNWRGILHLSFAAVFLLSMGFMAFHRFSINREGGWKLFYQVCGIMTSLPILILGVLFLTKTEWSYYQVYIFECISLSFFGLAWLVKGKFLLYFVKKK